MGKSFKVDLVVDERKQCTPGAKSSSTVREKQPVEARKKKDKPHKHADKESSASDSSSDSDIECCGQLNSLEPWRYPLYSPSASYRQVDAVSGSHQYTISGFTLACSMGCGTRLCSDFFEVCGQLFRLEVYPGGFTADTRRYVSVFLTTPGTLNPNHIMYEIAILDQSGKDRHVIEKRSACDERGRARMCCMSGPMLACSRGIIAAVPKFVKTRFLEKHCSWYMPCDVLVLRATVQILRGWTSAPMVHGHGACQLGMTMPGAGLGMLSSFMAPPMQPQLPVGGHQWASYPSQQPSYPGAATTPMPSYYRSSPQLQHASATQQFGSSSAVQYGGSRANGSSSQQSPQWYSAPPGTVSGASLAGGHGIMYSSPGVVPASGMLPQYATPVQQSRSAMQQAPQPSGGFRSQPGAAYPLGSPAPQVMATPQYLGGYAASPNT